jgi:hypothetical protein
VVAGGTGANNAADAMATLGGEVSKVQVTNYDSHAFKAGSFYSDAAASASPVPGHAFSGFCYPSVNGGVATTDMFIEARDADDSSVPPVVYIRQKRVNVWGAWMVQPVGGTSPNFSGTISVNDRKVLTATSTETKLYIAENLVTPRVGVSLDSVVGNAYYSLSTVNGHRFGVAIDPTFTSPPWLKVTDTLSTFSGDVTALTFHASTAIPTSENSTRVATTAWVTQSIGTVRFPQTGMSTSTTLTLSDAGKMFFVAGSSPTTLNIPTHASVPLPIGTVIMVATNNAAASITIDPAVGVTLYRTSDGSTANRTVAGISGLATLLKISNDKWFVWGEGGFT